jgi:hypothetical protein
MDSPEEVKQLLMEIRDLQREQLEEYRANAQRSIQLQEAAVQRQAAFWAIYKRVLIVGSVIVISLVGLVLYLLSGLSCVPRMS